MIIGPIDYMHLFLRIMNVSRQLLYTNFCIDDRREVCLILPLMVPSGSCTWRDCACGIIGAHGLLSACRPCSSTCAGHLSAHSTDYRSACPAHPY